MSIKKMFAISAIMTAVVFSTSCTRDSIDNEDQQIKKKELTEEAV